MKHTLIAAVTNYREVHKVQNFVYSWQWKCSQNSKLIVLYDYPSEITEFLKKFPGVEIVQKERAHLNGYLNRFAWFAETIDSLNVEEGGLVLTADIRDVVFQSNPFDAMQELLKDGADLVVIDEGITNEEEWNAKMMSEAFPDEFEQMRQKNVMNCGVIGGKPQHVAQVCREIFELGKKAKNETFETETLKDVLVVCDQPAFGIYIHEKADKKALAIQDNQGHFCLTMSIASMTNNMLYVIDGKLSNDNGEHYCIVHQYDRFAPSGIHWHSDVNEFYFASKEGEEPLWDFAIDCKAEGLPG